MSDIKEISQRIVSAREALDNINLRNVYNISSEQRADIEVEKATQRIRLERAKREYNDYIQGEINKQEAL